ncbi:sugar phosphate isomerase/epimerase family protein [Pseudomonas auratipiscis]|uniref:TIM barrel protein n=1 Tax=Pseudomonas auratipiscis TaxID=3115853 RepID=A0AB35WLL4_9PSED|nr:MULTISPECIES: TIM barrel protein [unclassified Pseudomonas]MEE1864826.1 TIM barrel protein [Pseudomonas sp. 120P]MEE1956233.1 TIM barrel protein [Pseudomonas sp. 119P]
MNAIQERFTRLLDNKTNGAAAPVLLTRNLCLRLIERIDQVRLFAHAYPLLTNLTHGRLTPFDLLDFAYRHELKGLSLHMLDGEHNSLSQMNTEQLRAFADKARQLDLEVHVEISSTLKAEVDAVIAVANAIGTRNIRVYSRYEGALSQVMDTIAGDLHYLGQQADAHDLYFDFEQHEELKSDEIARLLKQANHPRLHALFDFGNMINACEQPLQALANLAPYIRQVHLKGVRVVPEVNGFGHYGVLQGSAEDDLPSPRMVFELLMLGAQHPQVIAFILEQENHYIAPAFRHANEPTDPFIAYREMSDTPLPVGFTLEQMLAGEQRWANNQVSYVKGLLAELRTLAELSLDTRA